jgi:L-malate glycosyltransferase
MMEGMLKIGILCYPTYGGSGVIASEIGMGMARRGHSVHFISADVPRRLDRFMENVYFHEIELRDYPVFISPPYAIGSASKIVEVVTYEQLDVLHVHYAVPHATSAYLAKQVLGDKAPKIITTLHGTDITLVGNDRTYLPITRFSIVKSDGVTAPSHYLKHATYDKLNVSTSIPIEVIPNFVDCDLFAPRAASDTPPPCCRGSKSQKTLVHISNFRPVKRLPDVIRVLQLINKEIPTQLILIGDGPERSQTEAFVRELGLQKRVSFLGKLESFVDILQHADLFLLPSETESFGLAALEAMSCGMPVIASNTGGIPEVVTNGETGYLLTVGNVEEMAKNSLRLLTDADLYRRMSSAARKRVLDNFDEKHLLSRYEEYYRRILAKGVDPKI